MRNYNLAATIEINGKLYECLGVKRRWNLIDEFHPLNGTPVYALGCGNASANGSTLEEAKENLKKIILIAMEKGYFHE